MEKRCAVTLLTKVFQILQQFDLSVFLSYHANACHIQLYFYFIKNPMVERSMISKIREAMLPK